MMSTNRNFGETGEKFESTGYAFFPSMEYNGHQIGPWKWTYLTLDAQACTSCCVRLTYKRRMRVNKPTVCSQTPSSTAFCQQDKNYRWLTKITPHKLNLKFRRNICNITNVELLSLQYFTWQRTHVQSFTYTHVHILTAKNSWEISSVTSENWECWQQCYQGCVVLRNCVILCWCQGTRHPLPWKLLQL